MPASVQNEDALARHLAALARQGWTPEQLQREAALYRAAAAQREALTSLLAALRK